MLQTDIPSADDVRVALLRLTYGQMQELARLSDVPFTTLWKVRCGDTPNPRIETVRKFAPHVEAAGKLATQAAA